MTNDIKTRRLIVTLPDVSGEEADTIAQLIDDDTLTDGFTHHGTVTHALGESLPVGIVTETAIGHDTVILIKQNDHEIAVPDAYSARQLAGVLLAHADEIEATS